MKELYTEIETGAPAERVWGVLTDFASYPHWNPFIRRISGQPVAGERLEVRIEPPGGRGMTFRPTVINADPNRELRWLGRLLLPGIFDGEHSLSIQPLEEYQVRFVQREEFRGVLVALSGRSLDTNTRRGFEEMNRALKERVETGAGEN